MLPPCVPCCAVDVVKAKLTGQSQIQYHLSKPFFRGRRGLTFRSRGLYGTLWYTDHSQLQVLSIDEYLVPGIFYFYLNLGAEGFSHCLLCVVCLYHSDMFCHHSVYCSKMV